MTKAEDNARDALRQSMRLNGDLTKGAEGMARAEEPSEARMPRIIFDMKVPIWGVACGVGVLVWALVTMYFTLQDVLAKVNELQGHSRTNGALMTQYAGEQAILKYRIEKLEQHDAVQGRKP
jgi:hypothetical protein